MKNVSRFLPGKQKISGLFLLGVSLLLPAWKLGPPDDRIKRMDPKEAAALAKSIEATVTPELVGGLSLKLWGVDSLVADPIGIDIDDKGNLYYTRTNRQKNSEFDIRGHQDWEIPSIALQTVEDKRAFLRKVLSPETAPRTSGWPT